MLASCWISSSGIELEKKGSLYILLDYLLLGLPKVLVDVLHAVNQVDSETSCIIGRLHDPDVFGAVN